MSDNGPPLGALPLNLPDIPDDQIDTLAKDIEKSGFAVLPSYVGSDLLAHLRDLVGGLVAASGGEYTVRTGREETARCNRQNAKFCTVDARTLRKDVRETRAGAGPIPGAPLPYGQNRRSARLFLPL
jgi:hypothetical protein